MVINVAFHSEHRVKLPSGMLSVRVNRTDIPLKALCGFGCRQNPKRGFLFVSKVLGKHYPVCPSQMRAVQRMLADKINSELIGPIVFLGMAETATCLGQAIHEEYLRRTGRNDVLFLQTTRYHLDRKPAFVFSEEHSHATAHLVHVPECRSDVQLLREARTIILIDDEASTGNTFSNLASAFKQYASNIEHAVLVMITDWTDGQAAKAMPIPTDMVSILSGTYSFQSSPHFIPKSVSTTGNGLSKFRLFKQNYGRLGCRNILNISAYIKHRALAIARGQILVLGTGEFSYLPFRLAEYLKKEGLDVRFQTTTRSPIMVSNDIQAKMSFPDNYGDEIPNFLYNVNPEDYDTVIVCYETPFETVQPQLIHSLKPVTILF